MKKLIIILFLFWAFAANATTYYFSAIGVSGNTGLSQPSQTWPLSKLYSVAFAAGDSCLFNKGDTFTGTGTFSHSGSSGNYITIDVYGNGNNPIIDGGAATSSPNILVTGAYIHINNIIFQNSLNVRALVELVSTHDININNCYFTNGVRGVLALTCTNNIVVNKDWFGTHLWDPTQHTTGGGCAVQFNNTSGSGNRVNFNHQYEPNVDTLQGDLFNLYQSNGISGDSIEVNGNFINGGSPSKYGNDGIILGDVGNSSYQEAIGNTIINGGNSGAMVSGGIHINMSNNLVYGAAGRPIANGGIQYINNSAGGTPQNSSDVTIGGNRFNWIDQFGNRDNAWYEVQSSPTATQQPPYNWSTNTAYGVADAGVTASLYTGWTGSPWNSPIISYSSSSYTFAVSGTVSQSPTNTGTASTTWTVSPALPTGLSINSSTGVISGTPTIAQSATNYIVYASNTIGKGTSTISITISASASIQVTGRKFVQL